MPVAGFGLRVASCGLRVAGCAPVKFATLLFSEKFNRVKVAGCELKERMMASYRDLEIYKLSYDLAIKIHKMSLKLPKYEMYEEGSQIRKSSKGITSCIVEGYGRKRYKAEPK